MTLFIRFGQWPALAIGIALLGVGCHSNQAHRPTTNTQNQGAAPCHGQLWRPASQASPSQGSGAPISLTRRQRPAPARRRDRTHRRAREGRRMRAEPTRRTIRMTTKPTTASSRNIRLTKRHHRCPITTSLPRPATTISGRPATGPSILQRATTGCPACGSRLLMRARLWTPGYWGYRDGR